MLRPRHIAMALALAGALLSSACGNPPEKEMQQALGAIEAARAAGADEYALEEFAAAELALKNAEAAVAQRDYRLALNHALDSRERAQTAAKQTADNKAVARGDADRLLVSAMAALNDAHTKLEAAQSAKVPLRTLAEPQRTIADADATVQEARTKFSAGDYLAVIEAMRPLTGRLAAAAKALDVPPPAPPRRRR